MRFLAARLTPAAGVAWASLMLAACGSGSPHSSTSASSSSKAQSGVSFARCMRAHGVPAFPDPSSSSGTIDLQRVPGINTTAPAFRAARTACMSLLPVKQPVSQPPSAHAHARLLRWAECMRTHGISGLPDPRPDPAPPPNSAGASRYGTLMGDGGYWVGIPTTINAHSPAFEHLSNICGESTGTHHD